MFMFSKRLWVHLWVHARNYLIAYAHSAGPRLEKEGLRIRGLDRLVGFTAFGYM